MSEPTVSLSTASARKARRRQGQVAVSKGNGQSGNGAAKPPAWWARAKDELKNELKSELKAELLAELNPKFEAINGRFAVLDMKIDNVDRRLTQHTDENRRDHAKLAGRIDAVEARLNERIDRVEAKVDAL